eukprot:Gb_16279 [translate_table: standard]
MECLGFQQGVIAQQKKVENGIVFPMVLLLSPSSIPSIPSFLTSIQNNIEWLNNQLDRVGALLFRGFPVKNASDFNAVIEAFGWEEQPYLGAASRTRIQGRVYTANEAPLHETISFHHEMSKFKEFPSKLFFFCEIASPEGGQTAIALSHKVTQRMEHEYPKLVSKLEKEGLICTQTVPREDNPSSFLKGWQSQFQTKDRNEAEKRAAESGKNVLWLEDNSMEIVSVQPQAAIKTFKGDKKSWFNQIAVLGSDSSFAFGDGTPLPAEVKEGCIRIANEECVEVNWEAGDVLLLDNQSVMHARRPGKAPRRVLVALCK